MENIRVFLSSLPSWLLTGLTAALILWLTLSPDPLGDDGPQLFEGADKVVHAIMFGFLTAMILLDYQRRHGWRRVSRERVVAAAVVSTLAGIGIEIAQLLMALGRGFETADMAADAAGAALVALLWLWKQPLWSENNF